MHILYLAIFVLFLTIHDTNAFIIPAIRVIKRILNNGKINKDATWVKKVERKNNEQNMKKLEKKPDSKKNKWSQKIKKEHKKKRNKEL